MQGRGRVAGLVINFEYSNFVSIMTVRLGSGFRWCTFSYREANRRLDPNVELRLKQHFNMIFALLTLVGSHARMFGAKV